jgi:hypothetical protein
MSEKLNGISTLHPAIAARLSEWDKIDTFYEGIEAIIEAGEKFTPKLCGQSDDAYNERINGGHYFNTVYRTVQGLNGMLYRKAPEFTNDTGYELEYITSDGQPIENTSQYISEEVLKFGLIGALVDYPADAPTDAQATASIYEAGSIVNYMFATEKGETKLVMVVLKEAVSRSDDMFSHETEVQYRLLVLDSEGLYQQITTDESGQIKDIIEPIRANKRLDYIPFALGTPKGVNGPIEKSVLLDLVNVAQKMWINSCDNEQSLKWSGFNQFIGYGFSKDDSFEIGAPAFTESTEARAEIIAGSESNALKGAIEDKKQESAVLGANILAPQGRYVQSAETATIQATGEASVLSAIRDGVSAFMTWIIIEVLKWHVENVENDAVAYSLTNDFFSNRMGPQEQISILQLWQSGVITNDTLVNNYRNGEIIQSELTNEEYIEQLEQQKAEQAQRQEDADIQETEELFNA